MTTPSFNPDEILAHSPWIRKVVRSMLADEYLADDLAQEALEAGLRQGSSIQGSTRSWLYGVVKNLHRQFLRGQKNREQREHRVAVLEHQPDSEELVEKVEIRQAVEKAVLALPAEPRDLLILRYYEELSVPQMAKLQSVSVQAMESRLHRAKQLLRVQLQNRFGDNWTTVLLPMVSGLPSVAESLNPLSLLLMNKFTQAALVLIVGTISAAVFWPEPASPVVTTESTLSRLANEKEQQSPPQLGSAEALLAGGNFATDAGRVLDPGFGVGNGLTVRVVDDEGNGVAEARVVPWSGQEVFEEGYTDATGTVVFGQLDGDGGFAVLAPGYLTAYFLRDLDKKNMELQLPSGRSVAGEVKFIGKRHNPNSFRMKLMTRPHQDPQGVPEAVLARFQWLNVHPGFTYFLLDEENKFRVHGLPVDWAGRIELPTGALFETVGGTMTIDTWNQAVLSAPSENLLITVREMRGISGRVVTPTGGHGVGGVEVSVGAFIEGIGMYPVFSGVESNEDGSFYTPIWLTSEKEYEQWKTHPKTLEPKRVDVTLGGNSDWAGTKFRFDGEDRADIFVLGDLPMAEWELQKIHVVDEQGQPIAGAIAFAGAMSEPTEESGNLKVQVRPGVEEIAVSAPGFGIVKKSLVNNAPEVLEFVLPRAVQVTVKWQGSDDMPRSTLMLQIQSEGAIFVDTQDIESILGRQFRSAFGVNIWSGGGTGSGGSYNQWKLESDQTELTLWGLMPGTPMEVSLVGSTMATLSTSGLIELTPGEDREILLPPIQTPVDFNGKILDSNGNGLEGVEISLTSNQRHIFMEKTRPDGSFTFKGLASTRAAIDLRLPGYANQTLAEFLVPDDGSTVEYIMDAARHMTIYFRDAAGRGQLGGSIFKDGEQGQALGVNGGFSMSKVPQSSFDLLWRIGGIKDKEIIPADVVEHVIVVPSMASASIHTPSMKVPPMYQLYVIFVPLGDGSDANFEFRKSFKLSTGENGTDLQIPSLLPGEYQVQLSMNAYREEEGGWKSEILDEVGPVVAYGGELLGVDFMIREY
ncbi:MAG: sigma-70 family RNA polymerase sigma factor [Planctomycetes bacterium]|nr:sigma-70 family RNA polymerase sigma factor [Planctomycetota bacterium]